MYSLIYFYDKIVKETRSNMLQPYQPGAMTTIKVNLTTELDEINRLLAELDADAGKSMGRLEHLNVNRQHIAQELLKEKLVLEGKIAEAEQSRK